MMSHESLSRPQSPATRRDFLCSANPAAARAATNKNSRLRIFQNTMHPAGICHSGYNQSTITYAGGEGFAPPEIV